MTIDEAIKVLSNLGRPGFGSQTEKGLKARKLGIEALERIKANRRDNYMSNDRLLPGETEPP